MSPASGWVLGYICRLLQGSASDDPQARPLALLAVHYRLDLCQPRAVQTTLLLGFLSPRCELPAPSSVSPDKSAAAGSSFTAVLSEFNIGASISIYTFLRGSLLYFFIVYWAPKPHSNYEGPYYAQQHGNPKSPCTQIVYTVACKYPLYRYIVPEVYTIWVTLTVNHDDLCL